MGLALYLCSRPSIILFLSMRPSVYLYVYLSLSRSIYFLLSLSVFPVVLRSIHLSSCVSSHAAIHFIYLSTQAFHPSIYVIFHLSIQTV